ncbi:MAG: electron transport complex subunit RsxC [Chromatiales bacterium]|jgi:electron transport complex protein RnfC
MYVESKKSPARQLWRFHGGLHLPDNKQQSLQRPLRQAQLPERLILPLQQHIGEPTQPLVKVGETVLKGQKIADSESPISAPIHAPTSGLVVEIADHPIPHPSGLTGPCIVIEPDGREAWVELPPAIEDYLAVEPAVLRARIREAGIVGMGGATFPSAVKLNPSQPIHTLILNGAECEPYITCDDQLMQDFPERVLDGARILLHLLGAKTCLIGVEDNKPAATQALQNSLTASDPIEVVTIPTRYPSGGEKQLIRILTGSEVPSPGFPAQLGMVCHNVATAAAIANAVIRGRPLISRLVTLTGEGIAEPGNLEAPLGIMAADLIRQAGGYTGKASQLILGGPMMGFDLSTDRVPITKGANCLLAPSDKESPAPTPARACIRCSRCAEACPVNLLPQQMYWYSRAKDLDKVQDYNLFDCIECGCCSYVCPSHIPLVQYFRFAKTESWAKERDRRDAERAKQRHEFRLARLERLEAERKARLRQKKEALQQKPGTKSKEIDSKKAAIQAAMQRAAAKKAKQQRQPKNTQDLTPAQQAKITEVDKRRAAKTKSTSKAPADQE